MEKPVEFDLDSIDLKVYLKILLKRKLLIAGITLLAVATSAVLSFLVLPPVYQSKTVIMVKEYQDPKAVQRQEQQDDLESAVSALSRLPQMTIKTYVGQIKSEALLREVIKELKLDKTLYTPRSLASLIDVKAMPETNLIEISVKNNDAKLAAQIANTLTGKFMDFVHSANEQQLVRSGEFLSKQLAEENKKLSQAVNDLNKFRSQERNITYLEQEVQNKTGTLATLQSQLIQVEADYQQSLAAKIAAEEKLKSVPEKVKTKKTDPVTGSQVEGEEINPAYAELSQLATQKGIELAGLEGRKDSLQGAIDAIKNELKSIQAELNSKKETGAQLQEKADQIKRTRDVLAEKLTQVQIIKSVNLGQTILQVVTPAFVQDSPVSPRKTLNMAIALVLGLMVSVGLALVLEMLDNTINKTEDIDQHLGLPILGAIPLARSEDFVEKG